MSEARNLSADCADDKVRSPHLMPRTDPIGCPGGSSLSLADAFRRRPRRHLHGLHRDFALGNLVGDVAGLIAMSPTGSERIAPTLTYFFFFATLRFAGAFFFAADFAFAFFTMLPS
jgi:hypothetical protein